MSRLLNSLIFFLFTIISIYVFTLGFGVQKIGALASFPGLIVIFFIILCLKVL